MKKIALLMLRKQYTCLLLWSGNFMGTLLRLQFSEMYYWEFSMFPLWHVKEEGSPLLCSDHIQENLQVCKKKQYSLSL